MRRAPGTVATTVRPEAVEVMREIGIDISHHASKTLEPFLGQAVAWLVTVCDEAREACPTMPGVLRQEHWSIADPSLAEGDRDDAADRVPGCTRRAAIADRGLRRPLTVTPATLAP